MAKKTGVTISKTDRTLTAQETAFVRAFVDNGGNASEAARMAGYAGTGGNVAHRPVIQAAIFQEQRRQLQGMSSKSLLVLKGVLDDATLQESVAGRRVQVDACKTILDRAGHVAPKAPEALENNNKKDLGEWSVEELEDFIRNGREALKLADQPQIDGEFQAD
jgi:type IV pilus biogenesis protein CpaD/CtpE